MSELRALARQLGLRSSSKLRKADLISLLRFDPEESDNENKVDSPSHDRTIAEEGEQKQFDPEESDNEE